MNTAKIIKLLSEINAPPRDGKWHIVTSISITKQVRSGKRKGKVLIDESSVFVDLNPLVYQKLIEHLSVKKER